MKEPFIRTAARVGPAVFFRSIGDLMRVALLTTTRHGHRNPYVPAVNALQAADAEDALQLRKESVASAR